jgi:uncharacterized protein YbaR (Trm112 family)
MVTEDLIRILRCPETRQPVALAPQQMIDALNGLVRQGTLRDVGGEPVERPLEAGLMREDGRVLYPVIDGIPRMLIERGIRANRREAGGS